MRNNSVIILAGGRASRLGIAKTLVTHPAFKGYWLEEQIRQLTQIGISEIIVVLGFHAERELRELPKTLAAKFVINPLPERGHFSSLQEGLRSLEKKTSFVLPIDVPAPKQSVWEDLDRAMRTGIKVCTPVSNQKGGHPVLLSENFCRELMVMDPIESRLDRIIQSLQIAEVARVPVTHSTIHLNLNRAQDWREI